MEIKKDTPDNIHAFVPLAVCLSSASVSMRLRKRKGKESRADTVEVRNDIYPGLGES